MDDNPTSLKELFSSAEEKRLAIESAHYPPNSPEYHSAVSSALQAYQTSLDLISTLSLFSPNETLEDLSTSQLPYLLTHYHLAELTQRLPAPSLADRKRLLTAARSAYERYLHLNDTYDLLTPPYKKLLERYTDSPLDFAVASTSDPALRRDAKIANLKAEKELRSRLDFLRKRPEYGNGADGGDEEVVRQTHVANLAFCTHMAFQALEGLNREWDVLGQAPEPLRPEAGMEAEEDARRRAAGAGAGDKDGYSERLDQPLRRLQSVMGGPLLTKQGKPLQPFTLLGNRQELAQGVFRPGHNLPTMTIDEYLEEERRRGGIIEGGGEASGRQPEPDEDNYEKADAETMKAREWDEFTESNHRGSGNTLNRG
ncbi:TAP42-like protein [Podospora aff. communis PSN243]|uniref:TAP42-like protein n=1 Tax=Podospora aff. communis PSN243 TaxID=3040156 RepID=A0AAV9H1X4_9PEZI|nr:TAP42-like protein [Podospora aff. communis PSN243]